MDSNDIIIFDGDIEIDTTLETTFPREAVDIAITKLLASDSSSIVNVGPFMDMLIHGPVTTNGNVKDFFDGNLQKLHPFKVVISNNIIDDNFDLQRFCLEWNSDERQSYIDRERMSYNLLRALDNKDPQEPYFHSLNPINRASVYIDSDIHPDKQYGVIGTIDSIYPGDKLFIVGMRNPTGEHEFDVRSYMHDLKTFKKGHKVVVVFNTFATHDGMLISEMGGIVKDDAYILLDKPVSIKLGKPITLVTIPLLSYEGYYVFGEGVQSFSKDKISEVILSNLTIDDSTFIMNMILPSPDEVFTCEMHKHKFFNTVDFEKKTSIIITHEILYLLKAVLVDIESIEDAKVQFAYISPETMISFPDKIPDISSKLVLKSFKTENMPSHNSNVLPILEAHSVDIDTGAIIATQNGFFEFKDGKAAKYKIVKYIHNVELVNDQHLPISKSKIQYVPVMTRRPISYNPQYFIEKKYSGDINLDGESITLLEDPDIGTSSYEIEQIDYVDIPNFEEMINSFVIAVFTSNHPEIIRVCEIVNLLVKQFTEMYFKSKSKTLHTAKNNNTSKAPDNFWLSNATYNSLMDANDNNEILVIKNVTIIIKSYLLVCVRALIKFKEFQIIGLEGLDQNEAIQKAFEKKFGWTDIDPKFVNSIYMQTLKYNKMLKGIVSKESSVLKFIAPFNVNNYTLDKWVNYRPGIGLKYNLPNTKLMSNGEFAMAVQYELKNDMRYSNIVTSEVKKENKKSNTIVHIKSDNVANETHNNPPPRQLTQSTNVTFDNTHVQVNYFENFMKVNEYNSANSMFVKTMMNNANKDKLLNTKVNLVFLTRFMRNEIPFLCKGNVIIREKNLIEKMNSTEREDAIIHAILGAFDTVRGDQKIVHDLNLRLEQTIFESEASDDALEKKFDKLREKHNAFIFNTINSLPKEERLFTKELLDAKVVDIQVDMDDMADEEVIIDAEDNE